MEKLQERRSFVRLNLLSDVIYTKSPKEERLTFTKNISKGGICIIAYEELKKSELLDLEIYLPDDNAPINAKGKVAWSKEFIIGDKARGKRFDVGVEFVEINDSDLNKIDKYVFRHAT